ncbi:MAG: terminase [Salinarimonas sp.]|nr:terminase [Salinarimonas sp.]
MITIDDALTDPNLFGAALGDPEPWAVWRVILKAAFALPMTRSEIRTFRSLSGRRRLPRRRVAELWVIAGRRGGKSRMAALIASYIAGFEEHKAKLAPGETGHVLALSPSKAQARTVADYCEGFYSVSPVLAQSVEAVRAESIRLQGNIEIGAHANSFRTVRGRTLLAAIFDESAFWRDETSAMPDIETYRAVLPALATTGGMLVGISSPYRKVGLLHQKWRDHFGQDGDVLVIQAPTLTLNPTIDADVVARARKADPESAKAEWDGEFRGDISQLLDDAMIDAAIEADRPIEIPPREGAEYVAFVDPSGGRHDAFTWCIGHREKDLFVADMVKGRKPPFDPNEVVREIARDVRAYGLRRVTGDNFAGEWVKQSFSDAGISYVRAEMPKSQLYLEAVPSFSRRTVQIPNHPVLIRELRLLERRTTRSGRDSVDHPQNGTDDFANALVGAMRVTARTDGRLFASEIMMI